MRLDQLAMPLACGGFFWLVGALLMLFSLRSYRRQGALQERGKTVDAQITRVVDGVRKRKSKNNLPTTVWYQYTIDGQEHQSRQRFPPDYRSIRQGDSVPLLYLEENPKWHQLQGPGFDHAGQSLFNVGFGIVIIILGIAAFVGLMNI